jgi:hypothetical protein
MCCLGFLGKACGLSDEKMLDEGYLTSFDNRITGQRNWLMQDMDSGEKVEDYLVKVNDSRMRNNLREKLIKAAFEKYGKIRVKFVG